MTDVDVYSQAQRAVDAATLEQCDALQAALYARADRDWPGWDQRLAPSKATNIIGAAHGKPLMRVRPTWLEVIRGVKCCDPAVTRYWQASRWWIALACIFVGVVLILDTWQRAVLIGVACVVSLGARWTLGPKRCGP